jgi:hypothetical protein
MFAPLPFAPGYFYNSHSVPFSWVYDGFGTYKGDRAIGLGNRARVMSAFLLGFSAPAFLR